MCVFKVNEKGRSRALGEPVMKGLHQCTWWMDSCFSFEATASPQLNAADRKHTQAHIQYTCSDMCCAWHTFSLSHVHTQTHTTPPSQQPTHVSHILTRVGLAPGESSLELPLRNQIHFIKLPDVTTNPLPLDAAFTRQEHGDVTPAGAGVVTRTQT